MQSFDEFYKTFSSVVAPQFHLENVLNFPPPPFSMKNQKPAKAPFDINAFLANFDSQTGSSDVPLKQAARRRVEYCKVCKKTICTPGGRTQGPRRHILQYHLRQPLFSCPHCPYTSNYDKAHIRNHIIRVHPDLGGEAIVEDKTKFANEEDKWFERCFGKEEVETTAVEMKSPSPPLVPVAITPSPSPPSSSLSHSIEHILSSPPSTSPSPSPPFPIDVNMFPQLSYLLSIPSSHSH